MRCRKHLALIWLCWVSLSALTGAESLWSSAQAEAMSRQVGGAGFSADKLPEGPLRARLSGLAPEAARRASAYLSRNPMSVEDLKTLAITANGHFVGICAAPPPRAGLAAAAALMPQGGLASAAAAPNANHSKPGATNTIYIDFTGLVVTGTEWNSDVNVSSWTVPAFSLDADRTTFSTTELAYIDAVWRRVSAMYAPWDVDVTTDPAVEAGLTTNSSRIARALVTDVDRDGTKLFPGIDPNPRLSAAGIAYLDVWGTFSYTGAGNTLGGPAWVYRFAQDTEQDTALIVAHEIGHNLNLRHDGNQANPYYDGHSSGPSLRDPISWGPIMGAPYDMNYTQWSKGEYFGSVTEGLGTQDDTVEIGSRLTVRADDVADTTVVPLSFSAPGVITARTGMITTRLDTDAYSFRAGSGPLDISVTTFNEASVTNGTGAVLYPALTLRDSAGVAVATSTHVGGSTTATIATTLATGGAYTLIVDGGGVGTPLSSPPSGFTDYGSLGTYTISGTVTASVGTVITHVPAGTSTNVSPITFTITFSEVVTGFDAADISVTGGTAGIVTPSGSAAVYTVTVAPTTDGMVTLTVRDAAATGTVMALAPSRPAADTITYDTTRPTATITPSGTAVSANPITFSVLFSEPVTGFASADIVATRGSVVSVTGSGQNYDVAMAMDAVTRDWAWDISDGAAIDAAGNPSRTASTTALYDGSPPTATLALATIDSPATSASVLVTASEPIVGLTANSFTSTGAVVRSLTAIGTNIWRLDLGLGNSGAVTVRLTAGGASDMVGNAILPASLSFTFTVPSVPQSGGEKCGLGGIGLLLATLAAFLLIPPRRR